MKLGEVDLGGATVDLNVTGSYSFTGFSVCLEAASSADTYIGPIPITVSGALDACPNVGVQTATAGNTGGSPTLSYDMKPGVDTSFTLSAGVGSSDVGSIGVFGSADIVNYGTDMTSTMTFTSPTQAVPTPALTYSVVGAESLELPPRAASARTSPSGSRSSRRPTSTASSTGTASPGRSSPCSPTACPARPPCWSPSARPR